MEKSTINEKYAKYLVKDYGGHLEVEVEDFGDFYLGNFKVFYSKPEVLRFIAEREKMYSLLTILKSYEVDMENYSYYGSNPGIPECDYEDVATDILKLFGDNHD